MAFLARAVRSVGWEALSARVLDADPRWLAACLGALVLRYVVWGLRWTALLRAVLPAPWLGAQRALQASVFFNMIVPAARPFGGLVRSRYLSRALGAPMGPVYGTAFVDQAGYSAVSLLLGALAVGLPSGEGSWTGGRRLLGAGLAAAGLVFLALLWGRRERVTDWARRRMPRAASALEGTVEAVGRVVARPGSWAAIALGGVGVWSGGVVALWCAARAVGADIGFTHAAAAWALGSMAGMASGTPGGAGTMESTALLQLTAFGIPAEPALAAILLSRGIEYLLTIGIGGLCAIPSRPRPAAHAMSADADAYNRAP